jgi:hypothetical protein
MGLWSLLFDFVAGIELFKFYWNQILFDILMVIIVSYVVAEKMKLLVLVINDLQDQLLNIFLV